MSQATLRTEGEEQIRPHPRNARQIRPSQFLNQLEFLPLLDQANYTERPKHKKFNQLPIQLPTIQNSDPMIKIAEQGRKHRHKHVSSLPDLQIQYIPHKMSIIERIKEDLLSYSNNKAFQQLIEGKQNLGKNGALSKDVIDGSKKPLKRLTRNNTKLLQSEMI